MIEQENLVLAQCLECLHVQELPTICACEECGGPVDLLRFICRGKVHHYGAESVFPKPRHLDNDRRRRCQNPKGKQTAPPNVSKCCACGNLKKLNKPCCRLCLRRMQPKRLPLPSPPLPRKGAVAIELDLGPRKKRLTPAQYRKRHGLP